MSTHLRSLVEHGWLYLTLPPVGLPLILPSVISYKGQSCLKTWLIHRRFLCQIEFSICLSSLMGLSVRKFCEYGSRAFGSKLDSQTFRHPCNEVQEHSRPRSIFPANKEPTYHLAVLWRERRSSAQVLLFRLSAVLCQLRSSIEPCLPETSDPASTNYQLKQTNHITLLTYYH